MHVGSVIFEAQISTDFLVQEEKNMIEKTISRDDVDTLETLFRKNNIDVNADLGVSVPSYL